MKKNEKEFEKSVVDGIKQKPHADTYLNNSWKDRKLTTGGRLTRRIDYDESTYIYLVYQDMSSLEDKAVQEIVVSDSPLKIIKPSDPDGEENLDIAKAKIDMKIAKDGTLTSKMKLPKALEYLTPEMQAIFKYFIRTRITNLELEKASNQQQSKDDGEAR